MAMNRGDKIERWYIQDFKNQINDEFLRRNGKPNKPANYDQTGESSSNALHVEYNASNRGGAWAIPSAYIASFNPLPQVGDLATAKYYNETVGYLAPIFTDIYNNWAASKSAGDSLNALKDAYEYISGTLAKDAKFAQNGSHHCRSYCMGLCSSTCGGACSESCTYRHGNCSWQLGGSYCNN